MKNILLTLAMMVSLFASAQKYTFNDLVGNWRNKQGAGLEISDSSKLFVVYGDQKKQLVNYAIDFSTNPAKFNFVVRETSGLINIKSTLYFIEENVIQWQVQDPDAKPVGYNNSQKKETVTLRKVEERIN